VGFSRELWMVTRYVGTAVVARSLASAIPAAVGATPSCRRNASCRFGDASDAGRGTDIRVCPHVRRTRKGCRTASENSP
jgi:hypothetical protein